MTFCTVCGKPNIYFICNECQENSDIQIKKELFFLRAEQYCCEQYIKKIGETTPLVSPAPLPNRVFI